MSSTAPVSAATPIATATATASASAGIATSSAPSPSSSAPTTSNTATSTSTTGPATDPKLVDYRVKWIIDEFGRSIPICMQNRNGPCALLALANACFLQCDMRLTAGVTRLSEATLMSMLAEYVSHVAERSDDSGNAERQAARQYAVTDFLDLLPNLNRGLDVNVRFDRPTSFEFTRELSIFDVFPHIRLVHGWLVDPQDPNLMVALAPLSYNQLMVELVRTEHNPRPSLHSTQQPTPGLDMNANYDAPPPDDLFVPTAPPEEEFAPSAPPDPSSTTAATDSLPPPYVDSVSLYPVPSNEHNSHELTFPTATADAADDFATATALASGVEQSANAIDSLSLGNDAAGGVGARGGGEIEVDQVKESAETAIIRELRPQVIDFIESNPTQLTVYGLIELHQTLNEGETAILFRNSHFYMLRKRRNEVYTLVTDEGYLNELNTVWEKLSDVNGDSTFYSGSFLPLRADGTVIQPPSTATNRSSAATNATTNATSTAAGGGTSSGHSNNPNRNGLPQPTAASSSHGSASTQSPAKVKKKKGKKGDCVIQ